MAVELGHLREDTDPMQMLFEIHGLILSLHHDARFLRLPGAVDRARAGFERIVAHYATRAEPAPLARRSVRRVPHDDLDPLARLLGAPGVTRHLGGPKERAGAEAPPVLATGTGTGTGTGWGTVRG